MPIFDSEFEQKLYAARRQTLRDIAELGKQSNLSYAEATYPNRFPQTGEPDAIPGLRAAYDHAPTELFDRALAEGKPVNVAVAGRLMAIRAQGKAGFAQLQGGGERLQIYVRKDSVGDTAFALYKLLDLGDHIGVHGYLFRTRTGELTVHVGPGPAASPGTRPEPPITLLSKAMLALPDKYHGLEDVELRYRQRYVDLIMNSGNLPKAEFVSPGNSPGASLGSSPALHATPPTNPAHLSEAQGAQGHHPGISPVTLPVPEDRPAASPGSSHALDAILSDRPSAHLTSRPERSAVERAASPATTLPPGVSAVTDTASPNEEHNDAPRNVREVFVKRAHILRSIRRFFDDRGFLEVETPMMHTVAGGAAARPFKTHHNALDIDLSLRIAPELYLKRLVVGGLDRVYEINRNFRNEGVSTQHNPEFTMLEFYQAYSNYHDLMDLTEELVTKVATEVNGTPITHFNGHEIDLSRWTRLSMREAIVKFWPKERLGRPPEVEVFASEHDYNLALARANEFAKTVPEYLPDSKLLDQQLLAIIHGSAPLGKLVAELFEHVAEPHLIQPTIIYDFPLAVSPLSKQNPDDPDWVERFEFYIGGFEVGNAFSELNDPEEQRKRFEQQLAERDRGDDEAHAMDEDYIRALAYGLPPTAGEGIGVDRLTMLLTGSRSIRDVILFPLLRPQKGEPNLPQATG